MAKNTKWTDEEMEVLRTMYHTGVTYKDIARVLNRSVGAVQQRAHKMGITGGRVTRQFVSEPLTSDGVIDDLNEISLDVAPNTPWWKRMLGL